MRRGLLAIIILALSSLACLFINLVPQSPTVPPTVAGSKTPVPVIKNTIAPTIQGQKNTPAPTGQGQINTSSPTTEEPTKTPFPTSVLDAQLSSEINLLQTQVVEERALQPKYPVPVVLLSTDQLRQNIVSDYETDYTDENQADDLLELSTIGLLDPAFDLRGLMINMLTEGIAGYYDSDTREMFVVQGQGFQGPERLTYSHEYTHVLQDQNYDFQTGMNYNDDSCELDTERCAAIQALIEGDATLSQTIWYQYYATSQDKQQVTDFYDTLKTPIYDSAPAFLKDQLIFPYNQGANFVQELFTNGGWSAVNAAYLDPPVSTEQIMHPNLYPSDKPIPVDLPDVASTLGEGWREVTRNQMGEFYTYLILARAFNENARQSDSSSSDAAAGWGGDEYLLLHNDSTGATVFVMKTVWDTTRDASQFNSTFVRYANTRFGMKADQQGDTAVWVYEGGYSSMRLSGATTIWIISPDAATAQLVTGLVQP